MVCAIYLRKSRAEEKEPVEATLARHKDSLTRHAEALNLTVAALYEEVASGDSLYARPQMLKLLGELDRYDAILCMDIDRLGRGAMRDQGLIFDAIRDAGVQIVTLEKTYNLSDDTDDSLIGFKALFAREEYKMIRGRLRRGIVKSVEEGCYISNAPFGYRQTRVNKKPTLIIDEREAEGVKLIFELYLQGVGCQAIADRLHAIGFRPRRGDKFSRSTVAKMIRNPVYIGKVVWNQYAFTRPKGEGQKHVKRLKSRADWLVVDGLHGAVVSEDDFREANRMLDGKYHPPYRRPDQLENPLAGILFCANCGKSMVRQPLYNRAAQSPVILCPTSGCCKSSKQDVVEKVLFSQLEDSLKDLESSDYRQRTAANRDAIRKAIHDELTRLNAQMGRTHELLEKDVYDIDTFLSRRDELKERIQTAREALSDAQADPGVTVRRLQTVLERYWDGTPYERNRIVKSLVARAEYRKPKGSGYNAAPDIDIVRWRG